MSKTALIAFAKDPSRVPVKTRLSKNVEEINRKKIYSALLKDCLAQLNLVGDTSNYLSCYPSKDSQFFEQLSFQFNFKLLNQRGENLGERMENCFVELRKHHERMVIFGTDTPNLPILQIKNAISQETNWDILIGDSLDGGYYTIGINGIEFKPIFDHVIWGENQVLKRTLLNCEKHKLKVKFLKERSDIDTIEDLESFIGSLDKIDEEKAKHIKQELNALNFWKTESL